MFKEIKIFGIFFSLFLALYFMPLDRLDVHGALYESLAMAQSYAREHVLLCLVPAFFIAGAMGIFIRSESVMRYLGAEANKFVAYGVASISGMILAVCSCTILPLFAGIYRMGAGLGPAIAFLYSGPAINVLAIILTARILGLKLGIARAIGAITFSVIIGVIMQLIFGNPQHLSKAVKQQQDNESKQQHRPLWHNIVYFMSMIGILVFANWASPENSKGIWEYIHQIKWQITAGFACLLGIILFFSFDVALWKILLSAIAVAGSAICFRGNPNISFLVGVTAFVLILASHKGQLRDWLGTSWNFAKLILPLLFAGVLIAGLLLGRVGHDGIICSDRIESLVGGNSVRANFFASIAGAFMYFATLTEVPILQGLIGAGMGNGPALALLLAGPALSLPNMLVIRSVIGTKKTICYVGLVIIMATISGILFGRYV